MKLTEDIARKIIDTVNAGLVKGVGEPVAGKMCVEAAVCFAFGLPHGDEPPCVGSAVRAYKIRLNDANWSSNEARANGLREVAVAQVGSDQIDQIAFVKIIAEQSIKQIFPITIRIVRDLTKKQEHKDALEAAAVNCEKNGNRDSLIAAKKAIANADAYAYANANAYAIAYANADAYAIANADADAYAYANAIADANAIAYAIAIADEKKKRTKDFILRLSAKIAVDALVQLGCEGAKFLWMCKP